MQYFKLLKDYKGFAKGAVISVSGPSRLHDMNAGYGMPYIDEKTESVVKVELENEPELDVKVELEEIETPEPETEAEVEVPKPKPKKRSKKKQK